MTYSWARIQTKKKKGCRFVYDKKDYETEDHITLFWNVAWIAGQGLNGVGEAISRTVY